MNSIYLAFKKLKCTNTDQEKWEWSKAIAAKNVSEILDITPMYIGNLNPIWKYWNSVITELANLQFNPNRDYNGQS